MQKYYHESSGMFHLAERDFIAQDYLDWKAKQKRRNFCHKCLKVTLFLVVLVILSRWF